MSSAIHLFKNIFWYIHLTAKLVFYCDFISCNWLNSKISFLRQKLSNFEFWSFPQWRLFRQGSPWTWTFCPVNCFANNITCSCNKIFCNFCCTFCCASSWKVLNIHHLASRIIILLHNFNHFFTPLVYFYYRKINIFRCKIFHLILNYVAIRWSIWITITSVTNILSMPWCITNQKRLSYRSFCPFHF